jgi:glycosyltransferase involved in cell wall biosynthesis
MSQQKIKVLHIIKSLGRGGAEMLLPETLQLHNRELFEFHYIYFLPWKDQMVESLKRQGVKVTCFSAANNFRMITRLPGLIRYVQQNKIQLIHSHLPWAGIVSRIIGKVCGIPVIYSEHNKQERYHIGTRTVHLMTMNLLSEIVAVSHDVAQSIQRHKPRLRIPVRVISNGVNTESFSRHKYSSSTVRHRFNIGPDVPIVGTIAVFRIQKQLDLWMELASKILKRVTSAHFIIVGDGPLKDELIRKRSELGLTDRIHMPGLETDVKPYLASFNVYMMSSRFEGLPVALLEAMSMECPPVSTDAGGIKEVIRHGVDGFICSVDESEKMVDHVCDLLQNESLQLKYGLMSRQRVIQEYSMTRMVEQLEAIYSRLAAPGT